MAIALISKIYLAIILMLAVFLAIMLIKYRKQLFKNKSISDKVDDLHKHESILKYEIEDLQQQNIEVREESKVINYQYNELKKQVEEKVLEQTTFLQSALEKCHESNKLKEVFLEKINREVRTPMNAILGFINLLSDPDISKIDREYYFKFIRESGNNLLGLIDNIVDFTKLETGELQIVEHRCNLTLLISDLLDKYRSKLLRENPNITLIFHKPEVDTDIYIDCKKVINVIDQLLNNAVKFTNEGNIEVEYKIQDNIHIIKVSDTGIGIEKKFLDIIFERFYQIEAQSRDVFKGAGLGLTIAKGIIDLLKGNIEVFSVPDKGTTFTIELPVRRIPDDKNKRQKRKQNYNWSKKVILVAEDEDSNFHFLEAILKKTKAKVLRAADGVEFLEIMDSNKSIDLVLLDIKMPGINGYNAIKVIRQQDISIPVIAQTAFNQPEDKQKCLDSGCNDYLSKPIDQELLLTKIANFFSP